MAERLRETLLEELSTQQLADQAIEHGQLQLAVKLANKRLKQGTSVVLPLTDHTTATYIFDGEDSWTLAEEVRGEVGDYA